MNLFKLFKKQDNELAEVRAFIAEQGRINDEITRQLVDVQARMYRLYEEKYGNKVAKAIMESK